MDDNMIIFLIIGLVGVGALFVLFGAGGGGVPPTNAFETFRVNGTNVIADAFNDILKIDSDGSILLEGLNTVNTGASPYKDWSYKKKITLNSTMIEDSFTDFPVLVHIPNDSDLATFAQNDGDDILFIADDLLTKLPHEFEFYNSTDGELIAWVKTDLSDTPDTEIYLVFGNGAASSQEEAEDTWNSNYRAVYHFSDLLDSTSNNNDLTNSGALLSSGGGKIHDAYQFDGISDYMVITDDPSLDLGTQGSFQSWFNHPTTGLTNNEFILHIDDVSDKHYLGARGSSKAMAVGMKDNVGGNIGPYLFGSTAINDGNWHHAGGTYDGTTISLYVDTVVEGSAVDAGQTIANIVDDGWIGRHPIGGVTHWEGKLDELRIMSIGLSQDWIDTEYNMVEDNSSFLSVGALEDMLDEDSITFSLNTPTNSTLGGIFSEECPTGQTVTGITEGGMINCGSVVDSQTVLPQFLDAITITDPVSSVTFSNFTQHEMYQFHVFAIVNGTGRPDIIFNNDTGSNYYHQYVFGGSGNTGSFPLVSPFGVADFNLSSKVMVFDLPDEHKNYQNTYSLFDASTPNYNSESGGGGWDDTTQIENMTFGFVSGTNPHYHNGTKISLWGWDFE